MRYPALLPLIALVSACTVRPNYAGPPKVGAANAPSGTFARGSTAVTPAAPTLARWWESLGDPTLDAIEERALADNPNAAIMVARVRQARGTLRQERAKLLPNGSASASYVHAQLPGVDLGGENSSSGNSTSLDFYNAGFDASWEIDLFGGQRRSTQAAGATLQAAEANVADAQVQLTADVAQSYIALRDTQARLAMVSRTADLQRQMLDLTRQRQGRGVASALDVERLEGQFRATQAQIAPMEADAEAYMNALAVLAGQRPGALDDLVKQPNPLPLPPASVAVGDPADLLQRRPDIRAAERQLASATAKIGVAEAARFPKVSFMGLIGIGGTKPGDLANLNDISALVMPQIQWNFLDFGRNAAQVDQAKGVRDEAEARYRQAVLGALKDAEDALTRFGHQRQTLVALAQVKASAERAATLMQQRYHAGTATLIDVLDAERQRASAEQNLAAGTAELSNDYIALQKALGLGWQPSNS
ncbi:MAG: efflux transporter outer membrane subunit [Candidatus Sphingomonas phytovorans]|nr:efflux transporter outer membrane subunit [Sphingomonas sp.]WEK01843.1 MAG: efflux transporter outer membrane subunit [Sphingomonas sp.]